MVASGMQEVISYSLVSLVDLEKSTPDAETIAPIRLANPMSEHQEYLRTNMRSSILNTLSYNLHQVKRGIKIFEIGRVYLPRDNQLPLEKEVLIGTLSGQRWSDNWLSNSDYMDIFDAKGILDFLFVSLHINPIFEPSFSSLFETGNGADIFYQAQKIGSIGSLNNDILDKFDIDIRPVLIFEIDLETLSKLSTKSMPKYETVSKYPGSYRDLALILDKATPSATVKKLIERNKLVHNATLFDLYEGKELDANTRSLAYRILFQSNTGTLTGEEINKALNNIVRTLDHEIGAILRS
jgi:phenylalanyl-tRNA synthetase beta chain